MSIFNVADTVPGTGVMAEDKMERVSAFKELGRQATNYSTSKLKRDVFC